MVCDDVDQAPKKDHAKLKKYDGVVLRFNAVIKDASPIDALRKFLVAWYVAIVILYF